MNQAQKIIDAINDLSGTIRRMQQRQPGMQYSFESMWAAANAAKEAAKEMEAQLEAIGAGGVETLRKPTPLAAVQQGVQPFQERAGLWLMECFSHDIAHDGIERNHRFLEESLELVQSLGCTASEAHQLVGYVFGRPVGEPRQELGGVMVTLAALCFARGLDMQDGGEAELARISVPEIMAKVKAKQAAKPKHSPLPQHPTQQGLDAAKFNRLELEIRSITKMLPEKFDCSGVWAAFEAAQAKQGGV